MAREEIQDYIQKGCQEYFSSIQSQSTDNCPIETQNTSAAKPYVEDTTFFVENNFDCLLSTIILFLEQDSISNVSMNLWVNWRRVRQETFTDPEKEENFKGAISQENGTTFQNGKFHLLFYKKESLGNKRVQKKKM